MQASRRAEESPCYQLISLSAPLAERDQDIRMQYGLNPYDWTEMVSRAWRGGALFS
jgi:hypothetical protein